VHDDLNVSPVSDGGLNAVGSVVLRRRNPLPDALEVDLHSVHRATRDRRRFGASDVVEASRLNDECRRTIAAVSCVAVSFLRRPRFSKLTQIIACIIRTIALKITQCERIANLWLLFTSVS